MKRASVRLVGGLSLVATSMALGSSCSSPLPTPSAASPPTAYGAVVPTGQITQVDFGRYAAFAQCMPPTCLVITPKTLAIEAPPAPAASLPVNSVLSLAAGEAIVTSGPPPSPPEASVSALNSAPNPPPTAVQSTRQVIVHFAFGGASLSADARTAIDQVAGQLPSARRIAISGRTDSVGSQQSNQALAIARANTVRGYLHDRYPHLTPAVTLEAQGTCCFTASNETPQGRALNRRVEVVFEHDAHDLR